MYTHNLNSIMSSYFLNPIIHFCGLNIGNVSNTGTIGNLKTELYNPFLNSILSSNNLPGIKNSLNFFESQPIYTNTSAQINSSNKNKPVKGKYADIINAAAKKNNIDPNLIRAVIKQESAFNPNATSYCGAQGLMQLMPETAAGLGVKNPYDPKQNIFGGTKYLAQQLKYFKGDVRKALAAYNAGPGAVEKYNGIPPYKETQAYVTTIMNDYKKNC